MMSASVSVRISGNGVIWAVLCIRAVSVTARPRSLHCQSPKLLADRQSLIPEG